MNDMVINGVAHGSIASRLAATGFDPRALRPYLGEDGRGRVTVNHAGKDVAMVTNATTVLRKDDWLAIDRAVVSAARPRLRLLSDLRAAGMVYNLAGGLGSTVLETTKSTNVGRANVSMDALSRGNSDRQEYVTEHLPLPIVSKDFSIPLRSLLASQRNGNPIDTSMIAECSRSVADEIEALLSGKIASYTFGSGTVYGLANFPERLTKTITSPAASGWTGKKLIADLLAARKLSTDAHHYGPWVLYVSPAWDQFLDADYSDTKGENTLRQRVAACEGITAVRTLDTLTGYEMMLVQQTDNVFRAVQALDITTVQWETEGGFQQNFKVLASITPQPRADALAQTGIVHMSV